MRATNQLYLPGLGLNLAASVQSIPPVKPNNFSLQVENYKLSSTSTSFIGNLHA